MKLLKEGQLANKDLFIKNISLRPDDIEEIINKECINQSTRIDSKPLGQKECEKLIYEYIYMEYPNYYQIKSFINLLSGQLKKFSHNFQLSGANLIQIGNKMNKKNLKDIRVRIINNFIINTRNFVCRGFNNLLNSQMKTFHELLEIGNYNEDKLFDISTLLLSNNDDIIISIDKIDPSLIFFHQDEGQEFSIISNCNKNDKEYMDLLELKRFPFLIYNELYMYEREKLPINLNNYRKFTHKMFLKEIKNILDIKNPIFNSDKNENNKNYKSIEEIVGEYVFTADNFINYISFYKIKKNFK